MGLRQLVLLITGASVVGMVALSAGSSQSIAHPDDPRISDLQTRVASLETQIAQLTSPVSATTIATQPADHTLRGTVDLRGYENYTFLTGGGCAGDGGYDDLRVGQTVTVLDAASSIIAIGNVVESQAVPGGICRMSFVVEHVPDSAFYQLRIGHRGAPTYSREELEMLGWQVALEIGD